MRQPVGGGQRQLQRLRIRYARAIQVRGFELAFFRQGFDLRRRAVHQHDADVQRAQDRHVQQDVGEVFAGDNRPIHAEHKRPLTKLRDVLEDAPQVGKFHVRSLLCFQDEE